MPITNVPGRVKRLTTGGTEMKCPFCKSSRLMEIVMELQGEKVTMHSCPACERRWWDRAGEALPLPSLLELVASH